MSIIRYITFALAVTFADFTSWATFDPSGQLIIDVDGLSAAAAALASGVLAWWRVDVWRGKAT